MNDGQNRFAAVERDRDLAACSNVVWNKLEFGHSGGVTERVDDAVAERGLEFCWLE